MNSVNNEYLKAMLKAEREDLCAEFADYEWQKKTDNVINFHDYEKKGKRHICTKRIPERVFFSGEDFLLAMGDYDETVTEIPLPEKIGGKFIIRCSNNERKTVKLQVIPNMPYTISTYNGDTRLFLKDVRSEQASPELNLNQMFTRFSLMFSNGNEVVFEVEPE
jgi:hypothetical protein